MPLKVRLCCGSETHLDSVRSYDDLLTKAQRRSQAEDQKVDMKVVDSLSQVLFSVRDQKDYEALEHYAQQGAAQAQHDVATYRVRIVVSREECRSSRLRDNSPLPSQPECKRLRLDRDVTCEQFSCPQTPVPTQAGDCTPCTSQSWDQDILSSIKRTVTKLHFGSRLPVQSLASC